MKKLLSALAVLAIVPACGESARARGGPEPERFSVDLRPINESGVQGTARLTLTGRELGVRIQARHLEPNRIHEQHVQGLAVAGQAARCPNRSADDNGDGLVELSEATGLWGRSIQALEPFPTVGGSGRLDYRLTLVVDPKKLEPLDSRVLVLRGRSADLNGDGTDQYVPDLPVACGTIRAVGRKQV